MEDTLVLEREEFREIKVLIMIIKSEEYVRLIKVSKKIKEGKIPLFMETRVLLKT